MIRRCLVCAAALAIGLICLDISAQRELPQPQDNYVIVIKEKKTENKEKIITKSTVPLVKKEKFFYVSSNNVNFRKNPSLQSDVIGTVNRGKRIFVVDENKIELEWVPCIVDGECGYIYSDLIKYGIPEEQNREPLKTTKRTSLGYHKVTAYCSCPKCCGEGGGKITAAGTTPIPGRTIGCNWLPLGTCVEIEGHQYIVEDRGASWVKGFDIFWGNDHNAALHSGYGRKIEVFLIEE